MSTTYFITGTDTDVGKTFVSCGLLEAAKKRGLSSTAFKPVAAGAQLINGIYKNDDAILLQGAITTDLPYEVVNPVCLEQAIAPHIAAKNSALDVSLSSIKESYSQIEVLQADFNLIEGAGGWDVPLNNQQSLAELPSFLGVSVVLIVGIRLGCLNHAMLTVNAIEQQGAILKGWVANCIDPEMDEIDANIAYLQTHIQAPMLARIPFYSGKLTQDKSLQNTCADCFSDFPFS